MQALTEQTRRQLDLHPCLNQVFILQGPGDACHDLLRRYGDAPPGRILRVCVCWGCGRFSGLIYFVLCAFDGSCFCLCFSQPLPFCLTHTHTHQNAHTWKIHLYVCLFDFIHKPIKKKSQSSPWCFWAFLALLINVCFEAALIWVHLMSEISCRSDESDISDIKVEQLDVFNMHTSEHTRAHTPGKPCYITEED